MENKEYANTLTCVCYMDGATSECGYRFTIRKYISAGIGYKAFKTVAGFKYFMDNYGLKVDKSSVKVVDLKSVGKGRRIIFNFLPKVVDDVYFWDYADLPEAARPFVGLVNGSYVTMFALDSDGKVTIYKPNPNADRVYNPMDYWQCARKFG